MAQAFLNNLLQMQNTGQNQGERCAICLEGYGTLSRDTGTIEIGIRLPCSHSIGSACIAMWLKDNNTCPICRREFFRALPRPYLEHGIMDGQENADRGDESTEDDPRGLEEIIEICIDQLSLAPEIAQISELIVQKLRESEIMNENHSQWCIIAVSIYIASHLTNEYRSPREIAAITAVEADHIRETYDLIYPEREHLVNAETFALAEAFLEEDSPLLCWPSPDHELTDEQIENINVWRMLKEKCDEGCEELGLDAKVTEFTIKIVGKLFTARFMVSLSPKAMVAVSIYMAAHISCIPLHHKRVAEAVDINQYDVRSAYKTTYSYQHLFLGQQWLGEIGEGNVELVLSRLPLP